MAISAVCDIMKSTLETCSCATTGECSFGHFCYGERLRMVPFAVAYKIDEVEEIMEAVSFNASEKPVEWQLSAACYVWDPKGRDNC